VTDKHYQRHLPYLGTAFAMIARMLGTVLHTTAFARLPCLAQVVAEQRVRSFLLSLAERNTGEITRTNAPTGGHNLRDVNRRVSVGRSRHHARLFATETIAQMKNTMTQSSRNARRTFGSWWVRSAARKPAALKSRSLGSELLEQRALLSGDGLSPWQNAAAPSDVNADGFTSPLDLLLVIRELNQGPRALASTGEGEGESGMYYDVNGDEMLTSLDVLTVIRELNAEGEGESVEISLEITDIDGNAVEEIAVGGEFVLNAYVQDLRTIDDAPVGLGVFSAYMDVQFDTSKASVVLGEGGDDAAKYRDAFEVVRYGQAGCRCQHI